MNWYTTTSNIYGMYFYKISKDIFNQINAKMITYKILYNFGKI